MAYPEPKYHKQETAKEYTKLYTLDATDSIVVKQEDGLMGYISAGAIAVTGSNTFTNTQIINGNLDVIGNISAQVYNVITTSVSHYSASTNFGLDIEDVHTFTGSLKITGSLDVIGSTTTLGNTVISGGIFVNGGISGQINATNNILSSSAQITTLGFASGSYETTGRDIVSSSAQITTLGFATTGSTNFVGEIIVSGSLLVSGSDTLTSIGNVVVSGSLLVSGSTTQIGNNTLIGNTVLSGSIEVSGSFTGSVFIDGDLDLQFPHNFYRWGNKLFNYGQFSDTTIQSGSANTAYPMKLNTTDISLDVSITSGSRIYVANTGLYNIQFSAQLHASVNEVCDFSVWFAMTGSQMANSNTDFSIEKATGGGFETAALNFLTPISSGSYVELYWSNTTGNGILQYKGTQINPTRPATPSVIVTVSQVA